MLKIENLHFTYKKPEVYALKGVSLTIERGKVYALLGPNGAGKTTLINNVLGFLKPDKGKIYFDGEILTPQRKDLLTKIGFEPQETILWEELNCEEHLFLIGTLYEIPKDELKERVHFLLNRLNLYDKRKTRAKHLSGGLRRRLQLAMAFLSDPPLLLLDEPSLGLDPQSRHFLWDFIKEKVKEGKAILLTTHLMEEAQSVADTVGILDYGKLIEEGTPEELIKKYSAKNLEDVFLKLTGRELRE